ncbi:MAG: HDOD domain-containing protein [Planctomycetota bacterium]|jgi:putative nucleotidyltransferase with HDIG domain
MATATNPISTLFARAIASGKMQLPPLPATATEVLSSCQSDTIDAARLSSVMHRDPALAASVLRVANSSSYVGRVPCRVLQQAISRLGLRLVAEIVTAVAVRGRLFANPRCAELLAALWQHSVLTAFFAKEIARMRRRNVEIAFLCGLLHDIGKAVLLNGIDRVLAGEQSTPELGTLLAAVREQHMAAGALLAAEWKLPDQIAESIAGHHDVTLSSRYPDLACMVRLADRIAYLIVPEPMAQAITLDELRADESVVALNVYPDELDALLAKRDVALQTAEVMQ